MSKILLTGIASDSHTWNLVYLELYLQELGNEVVNLGASVPIELVLEQIGATKPDVLVVSTVNGHGGIEGLQLAEAIGNAGFLEGLPLVIGGKLTTRLDDLKEKSRDLRAAGFCAVLTSSDALQHLARLLETMRKSARLRCQIGRSPEITSSTSVQPGATCNCATHDIPR